MLPIEVNDFFFSLFSIVKLRKKYPVFALNIYKLLKVIREITSLENND